MALLPTATYWPTTSDRLVMYPFTGARMTARSRLRLAVDQSAMACRYVALAELAAYCEFSLASDEIARSVSLRRRSASCWRCAMSDLRESRVADADSSANLYRS